VCVRSVRGRKNEGREERPRRAGAPCNEREPHTFMFLSDCANERKEENKHPEIDNALLSCPPPVPPRKENRVSWSGSNHTSQKG